MKKKVELKEISPGVWVGNLDTSTPSGEDFFKSSDRVAEMREMIQKKRDETCNAGKHNLTVIHHSYDGIMGEETFVRWCKDCGGIIVDVEGDSQPEHAGKMRFPKYTK